MHFHIAHTIFRLQHWSRFRADTFRSSDLVLQDPVLGIWPFLNRTGLVPPVTIGKGDRSRACDRSGARGGLLWEGKGCCDGRQVPIIKGAKIMHSHIAHTIFRLQHSVPAVIASKYALRGRQ